jgi:membrane protein DedA with SNARE-associated domain
MRRMRLAVFLPLTALGSGLWNTLLAGAGMLLGERWGYLGALIARYEQLSLVVLALAILGAVLWRVWHRRTKWPPMCG